MAESAGESCDYESDASASTDAGSSLDIKIPSPITREQMQNRITSLQQENRVLKMELETFKLRCKTLLEENRSLRRASVNIQAKAEQEEEFISNTLLKKIETLKKEKETLAMNYEQEEEFLTNDLSRKLVQLRQEKIQLEETLEKEQEYQVNKLMKKIKKMEAETMSKQNNLEQLRREKIDLENALEHEQEALVNRLWKRMSQLENEKRTLQERLEQPPESPREIKNGDDTQSPEDMVAHIHHLKNEVSQLKNQLQATQTEHSEKLSALVEEEKHLREENVRLQRKLMREIERSESLNRQLSESESSLEMDDERHFNEMTSHIGTGHRTRTVSSPIPYTASPTSSRPLSPGLNFGSPHTRCPTCGSFPTSFRDMYGSSPPAYMCSTVPIQRSRGLSTLGLSSPEKFVKPHPPPPSPGPCPKPSDSPQHPTH